MRKESNYQAVQQVCHPVFDTGSRRLKVGQAMPDARKTSFEKSALPRYCQAKPDLHIGLMKEKAGFTLMELLVVVLIIGILAAVALPQYQKAVYKTRYSQLMQKAHNIKNAQEIYYMANGVYADSMEQLDVPYQDSDYVYVNWSGVGVVIVTDYDKLCNNYQIRLDHAATAPGRRECIVAASSNGCNQNVGHQVCQMMTHKSRPSAGAREYYFD